jgi:Holliday junction resolvase
VGYETCRAAGSKGCFDVIAWNHLGTRFIQVKREKNASDYSVDIERIKETPLPPHSTGELWVWRDGKGWITKKVIKTA